MSPLGYIATSGGLLSVGLGVVVWALRLRLDGMRDDLKAANAHRRSAEDILVINSREFTDYRSRAEEKEAFLVKELHHFRKEELDGIEKEPDRDVRIRRRRAWVGSMLRITAPADDNNSRQRMHK